MKILTDKNIVKRIAILLIVVMSISFVVPNCNVFAKDDEEEGGKLLQPIIDLLMYIGDSILNLLQNNFLSTTDIVIPANSKDFGDFNPWMLIGIVIGLLAVTWGICVLVPIFGAAGSFAAAFTAATAKGARNYFGCNESRGRNCKYFCYWRSCYRRRSFYWNWLSD